MKGKYIYLVSYLYSASCLFSSCLVQLVDVAANLRRDSSRLISVWYLSPGLARSRGWNYCHSDQVLWHQQIIPISHLSLPFTGSTPGRDWTNTARGECKFWPKSNCVWCLSLSTLAALTAIFTDHCDLWQFLTIRALFLLLLVPANGDDTVKLSAIITTFTRRKGANGVHEIVVDCRFSG